MTPDELDLLQQRVDELQRSLLLQGELLQKVVEVEEHHNYYHTLRYQSLDRRTRKIHDALGYQLYAMVGLLILLLLIFFSGILGQI